MLAVILVNHPKIKYHAFSAQLDVLHQNLHLIWTQDCLCLEEDSLVRLHSLILLPHLQQISPHKSLNYHHWSWGLVKMLKIINHLLLVLATIILSVTRSQLQRNHLGITEIIKKYTYANARQSQGIRLRLQSESIGLNKCLHASPFQRDTMQTKSIQEESRGNGVM